MHLEIFCRKKLLEGKVTECIVVVINFLQNTGIWNKISLNLFCREMRRNLLHTFRQCIFMNILITSSMENIGNISQILPYLYLQIIGGELFTFLLFQFLSAFIDEVFYKLTV